MRRSDIYLPIASCRQGTILAALDGVASGAQQRGSRPLHILLEGRGLHSRGFAVPRHRGTCGERWSHCMTAASSRALPYGLADGGDRTTNTRPRIISPWSRATCPWTRGARSAQARRSRRGVPFGAERACRVVAAAAHRAHRWGSQRSRRSRGQRAVRSRHIS